MRDSAESERIPGLRQDCKETRAFLYCKRYQSKKLFSLVTNRRIVICQETLTSEGFNILFFSPSSSGSFSSILRDYKQQMITKFIKKIVLMTDLVIYLTEFKNGIDILVFPFTLVELSVAIEDCFGGCGSSSSP